MPLGTSSLTITSSLDRRRRSAARARSLFTDDGTRSRPRSAAACSLGAGVGYYAGKQLHVQPGDAAVINSGALWGTVDGRAVRESLRRQPRGSALASCCRASAWARRRRAAHALLRRQPRPRRADRRRRRASASSSGSRSRTSSRSATATASTGGSASAPRTTRSVAWRVGLIAAGILTRNMDAPEARGHRRSSRRHGRTTTRGRRDRRSTFGSRRDLCRTLQSMMEQRSSACPLDCPDLCGLTVTVDNGRVDRGRRRSPRPAHRRLHLRQGPQDRRPPVRRRSRAPRR